jgi:hypothetical protein
VFVDLVLLSTYDLRAVYILVNIAIRLKSAIKLFVQVLGSVSVYRTIVVVVTLLSTKVNLVVPISPSSRP